MNAYDKSYTLLNDILLSNMEEYKIGIYSQDDKVYLRPHNGNNYPMDWRYKRDKSKKACKERIINFCGDRLRKNKYTLVDVECKPDYNATFRVGRNLEILIGFSYDDKSVRIEARPINRWSKKKARRALQVLKEKRVI